ncbi:coiled-coil domain-containing protein 50-like isoform X4 [Silurus asotus]|uniref:Coiled-coil domain-containing protein 50-like isoform X4 n=1 Tax=Silurus asotus TaxID=30991 RepID=A0AAD5FNL1_SILAS|nr:coiled-coil domain-containing protein 50-like isoform X4 [Silurus asotus]
MTCSVFPSLWLVCREKQDCEYAREIQEELRRCDEEARRREEEDETTDTDMDFHTVQVAQDEELARYMQRQEKKGNRWSRDLLALERSHDRSGTGGKVAMKERIMCAGICLAPRTPHSVFYDYLPEPSVAPPSRRHANKPGRHKAKEKRESCKQQ